MVFYNVLVVKKNPHYIDFSHNIDRSNNDQNQIKFMAWTLILWYLTARSVTTGNIHLQVTLAENNKFSHLVQKMSFFKTEIKPDQI